MDNEKIGEQPTVEQANAPVEAIDNGAGGQSGSPSGFGKFKSAEALLAAYNALEAEFTRKSQRLSEIEKEQAQTTTALNENEVESELQAFLSDNGEAAPYADELKQMALQQNGKPEFEKLYQSLALAKLASGQSKEDNPIIKKYVFQDEQLKKLVVENYMKQLSDQKPPIVISSDVGESVTGQKPATPSSLADAKKLVEKMFS